MRLKAGMQVRVTSNSPKKSQFCRVTDCLKAGVSLLQKSCLMPNYDTYLEGVFRFWGQRQHVHLPRCLAVVCGELATKGPFFRPVCLSDHRRGPVFAEGQSVCIFRAITRHGQALLFRCLQGAICTYLRGGFRHMSLHLCLINSLCHV